MENQRHTLQLTCYSKNRLTRNEENTSVIYTHSNNKHMTQDNKQELYKELQTWHSGQEVTQMSKQEIGNIQQDLEPLP